MQWRKQAVTLFLDYDGTLHESLHIYAPAFRRAYQTLVEQGDAPEQLFTDGQIGRWLGYTAQEMWQSFLPQLPLLKQQQASAIVGSEMLRLIAQGQARLYAHTPEVLTQLRDAGVQLVFLSNCSHAYMEAHRQYFQLQRFFSAFYCIADYPVSTKAQMYQLVREQHPGVHIIVGDRHHDMHTAATFGLPAIGCRYGYGSAEELQQADQIIDGIEQLPVALEDLLAKQDLLTKF